MVEPKGGNDNLKKNKFVMSEELFTRPYHPKAILPPSSVMDDEAIYVTAQAEAMPHEPANGVTAHRRKGKRGKVARAGAQETGKNRATRGSCTAKSSLRCSGVASR